MVIEQISIRDNDNKNKISIETNMELFRIKTKNTAYINKKEMQCIADWLNKQLKEKEG